MIPQISLHPGLNFDFVDKLRIHARTRRCQSLQCGRRFELAIYQHSARGVRSFSSRLATFDYQNARSFFAKFDRQREPDDAATDHNDVPSPHFGIVEEGSPAPLKPRIKNIDWQRGF